MLAKKLALALATATIGAIGLTGTAQAAQVGDTCQVNPNPAGWSVMVTLLPVYQGYTVYYPEYVIIDRVFAPSGYAVHRSGSASGWLMGTNPINESTCY